MQNSVSMSSERRRRKASEMSSFNANQLPSVAMNGQNSCRQPMGDVGNIEVHPVF